MRDYIIRLFIICIFIYIGGAQQQAVVTPLGALFRQTESYASSGSCPYSFVAVGPIDLSGGGGINIFCSILASPTAPTCIPTDVFYNTTHFSIRGAISFTSGVVYSDIQLKVVKSVGSVPHTLPLVNQDGSAFIFNCQDAPSISSPIFDSLLDPIGHMELNTVDMSQSNSFNLYIKLKSDFVRPIPLQQFTLESADYIFFPYYIDMGTVGFSFSFQIDYQNVDLGHIELGWTGNSYSFFTSSPLDFPIGPLTLNSFIEFKVGSGWGYYLDTQTNSLNDIEPSNIAMKPLYGNSTNLKYFVKGDSIYPRKIVNYQNVPFIKQFPAPEPSSVIVSSSTTDFQDRFIDINFDTNSVFFTTLGPLLSFSFPNYDTSYPYGLTSYNGYTRHYRFPVMYAPSTQAFQFNVEFSSRVSFTDNLVPTAPDTSPPTLDSLLVVLLNETHSILRLGASDSGSGICLIKVLNLVQFINKNNLVSGNSLTGIYEMIIPHKKSLTTEITVTDCSGVSQFYSNQQLNFMFGIELYQTPSFRLETFTHISFSRNQVDVSGDPIDLVLYANISQTTQQLKESTSISVSIFFENPNNIPIVQGVYNPSKALYEFPFMVPPRLRPGLVRYTFNLNMDNTIDHMKLIGKFGYQATLTIINSETIDSTFPIVTKADSVNGQSDPLVWDLEFYDISGVKKVMVGITSEYDMQGKIFTLDGKNQTTFQETLVYKLDPATCRPMKYWISYIYTEDIYGNIGESFRYSNRDFHPFFKYDGSNFDFISLTADYCTVNILDNNPPIIQSITITPTTNSSIQQEQAQVLFRVSDDTLVSLVHFPVCYFTGMGNEVVSAVATVVSNSGGIVNYACDFIFPFTFGPQALLSIYGLSDIYFNYIGFSPSDLKALLSSFSPVYSIPSATTLIAIESTSSLEKSPTVLYIYGRGFKNDSKVEIKTDTNLWILVPNITTGSVLVLYDIEPSLFYNVTVLNLSGEKSLPVTLKGQSPVSSSSTPSADDSSVDSSSSPTPTPVTPTPVTPTPTPTSPICKTDCGASLGYGECKGTACVCNSPHSGLDCLSTIANTTIEPNPHIPSVNLTLDGENGGTTNTKSKFSSLIQLISLKELENGGNDVVSKHVFNNDQWINVPSESNDPDVKTSKYKYIINNSLNTTIYSTVQIFSQAKSITFGKQQLQMNPSTVKFTFNITSYPFSKSTNTLQLVMGASVETNEESGCSYQEFIQDDNESQYLKIQIDQVSLFGRFIGYGIIDGREESITNSVVNQADEIATQQTSNSQQSYIGLNIRYFQQTALLDPDFSVLIETKSASDQSNSICTSDIKSKKLSAAQIAGIVVGGVVFLVIVAMVAIYVLGKKSYNPIVLKLRRITKH
ncbi:hypothetical protein CYY_004513 [Polysphondylium violaceum]|uniref:EGF-like domain-containing protein n=1 Tax=Polysphondylium violaceum TaxID=133409 RepID=A0A8J4PUH2_9MYCE|nr:hypothetical protein CYY_004513 [Polysphondylium violaceum]